MFIFKKLFFLFLLSIIINADTLKTITSFEAQFSQVITNPSGKKAIYNGLIYIKEPNSIKWKYVNPFEKFVYINKNKVTIIEPELEQAIITKIDKEINILSLLNNATKKTQNSFISTFNNVEYTLNLKEKKLHTISYQDEIENKVVIIFKNVKQNHIIDEKIFKFHIPSEYDILKK